MKKYFAMIAVLLSTVTMSAQYYVGGDFGFTSSKISGGNMNDYSGSSYKIQPEFGYQLNDKIAIGVNLGFSKGLCLMGTFSMSDVNSLFNTIVSAGCDVVSDKDLYGLSLKGYNVNPYIRYTALSSKYVDVFVDGTIGMSEIKANVNTDQENYDTEVTSYKLNSFELALKPGIMVKASNKIRIIAKCGFIGYQQMKVKDYDYKLSRFGANIFSNNLSIGFIYAL